MGKKLSDDLIVGKFIWEPLRRIPEYQAAYKKLDLKKLKSYIGENTQMY